MVEVLSHRAETDWVVTTDPIDVSQFTESGGATVDLVLPPGVKLVNDAQHQVRVLVTVAPLPAPHAPAAPP